MLRIGIVAGETSGDVIAADLIIEIKKRYPDAIIEGIAGPQMQLAGCKALFDSERLAVMAFTEVLKRLPELLKIRKTIANHFIKNPPDVFIGVDAPDFNLVLEKKLKSHKIPVVHYVSPSVWAWRQYRVKKIAQSIDLMLTLLPFEMEFYKKHNVPVKFVGHPMADQIPLSNASNTASLARKELLNDEGLAQIIALLPGSRFSEVQRLLPLMLDTAIYCSINRAEKNNKIIFLIPAATKRLKIFIDDAVTHFMAGLPVDMRKDVEIKVMQGKARSVMNAADVILLASGTATLEAMLLNRPMVVTYKVSKMSYRIMKFLSNVDHVALPNFFGKTHPVPEYLQDNATQEKIGDALLLLLENEQMRDEMLKTFDQNHKALKMDASVKAADAILSLVSK